MAAKTSLVVARAAAKSCWAFWSTAGVTVSLPGSARKVMEQMEEVEEKEFKKS
jgi:hypothetical protein